VWAAVGIAMVADAFLQLLVVSDVWFPSRSFPTGSFKFMIYFSQMVALVQV
jgi:hypothetical protein